MLPPFSPFLRFTCLREERQRLAIKRQIPLSKKEKEKNKSKKESRELKTRNEGKSEKSRHDFLFFNGLRLPIETTSTSTLRGKCSSIVLKNELRPKRSTCRVRVYSIAFDTRYRHNFSSKSHPLWDQGINGLNVIYHANLCFVSSFVPLRSIARQLLRLREKDRYREKITRRFSFYVYSVSIKLEKDETVAVDSFIPSMNKTPSKAFSSAWLHCLTNVITRG